MNINSTISHYQGSVIMMNAILRGVSLQEGKNKKQQFRPETLKVKKLAENVDSRRMQSWRENCVSVLTLKLRVLLKDQTLVNWELLNFCFTQD